MRNFYLFIILAFLAMNVSVVIGQDTKPVQHPTLIVTSATMVEVPSIASQIADGTFKPAENIVKEYNPKKWGKNTSVPGKGLPKGDDPLMQMQKDAVKISGKAPILTFQAASSSSTPTDPTGAVGPNHFVNSWNSSFRIWDKAGNPLTAVASLGTILNGNAGDPIVMYDPYADRFIITEFYSNGFGMAVGQGPDPVNDGWYLYTFNTNVFPDYPKFSVWSDGYYITANKNSSTAGTSEVVFATQRDKMLVGDPTALMIGFPLTGIVTSGFYSPLGFNCNGPTLPPAGNAPIVYMQDDSWSGVSTDHLKIWNINVNWTTPASSTISSPQILNTVPFDGLFDGGSFSNLPQPSGGSDIDALQATIMYMAQYRRFPTYNSVVFNFVVDLNGADNYAGIRWYELRQSSAGGLWAIYQEGTYSQQNGHSAFSGNMCMDGSGNIALAYTCVSTSLFPSLRYTGRFASDPLGTMTMSEQVIANGTQVDPSTRYGDYSQMTIDPTDDATFWSIGEYFNGGRKNQVGVFQFAPPALTAAFAGTPTSVCSGSSVTFTDQSLGSPTSWNWSFPGGSPSSYNGQNPPAITYNTPGSYDVSLVVGDGSTTDPETKTSYITVQNIIADFSGTPATVVVGNSVTFTDNSSCNPTSWTWSFPGGTPSSFVGQNPPAITYSTEGIYDVALSVSKPGGSDVMTKTGYISVVPPEFNMQNGSITTCQGNFYDSGGASGSYTNNETLVETFYPSTSGAMIRFTFNTFSTELNYDYLYIYNGTSTSAPLIGTYNGTTSPGTVTASNASGALTFRFTSDASVTATGWSASISCFSNNVPPIANFSASTVSPAINTDVVFTDLSQNLPTSWSWSFTPNNVIYVNGTNASSQNPQVQFNAVGFYTVTLTATNANGSDQEIKTNYIEVILYQYCIPTYTYGTTDGDYISLVQLGSINNATGASVSPYYTYYSNLSTELIPGTAYTITLSPGTYTSSNYIAVWIDYNQNGLFETTEKLGNISIPPTPSTGTMNFTVPADATSGTTRMRVREVWSNTNIDPCTNESYGETEDYNITIPGGSLNLEATVFLEGPYNGTNMDLGLTGYIPLNQPFNAAPWNYPGTESVATVPANAVDWALLELRDATTAAQATGATRIARQAAFLRNDGKLIGTDGNPVLDFGSLSITNNLFLIVHHGNHLSVLSSAGLTQTGGIYTYNFSTGSGQAYGGVNAQKELSPGVWGMFSGDGDHNGSIGTGDKSSTWENQAGTNGYISSDYNLDSESNNIDKDDYWQPNLGKGTQVPN